MKYDAVLSYIGGLFGIMGLIIGLVMTNYNLCCYELNLAT
jgi:hypothetical protein